MTGRGLLNVQLVDGLIGQISLILETVSTPCTFKRRGNLSDAKLIYPNELYILAFHAKRVIVALRCPCC